MKLVENLSIVGEQLRLARLRRDLSIEQVALVMGTGTWVWVPVFMAIFLLYS